MQTLLLAIPAYVWWLIALAVVAVVVTTLVVILPFKVYFRALVSGAHVGFFRLVGMQLRKSDPALIVDAYINAKKAGLRLTIDELETHYMAGGDIIRVTNALVAAYNARIALSPATAKAIDLAGRDVLAGVKNSVNPKIIEIPQISAVAQDGIELLIKARVTVRVNISQLIGGAGEETITAKAVQAIVTSVGNTATYTDVLKDPIKISKYVLSLDIDKATAYSILNVSIADISVGKNVGADLKATEAESNKRIAQSKAEEKRAMAVATEQEMRARTQEMKAQVLLAESEVPKAMAEAFKTGRIGVMDYYKMQNIVADTQMKKSIGNEDEDEDDNRHGGFSGGRR